MDKKIEETTELINNELTERIEAAYLASNYTLLNGGTDNVVMVGGHKDGNFVDILLTLEGMEEMAENLRNAIKGKKKK